MKWYWGINKSNTEFCNIIKTKLSSVSHPLVADHLDYLCIELYNLNDFINVLYKIVQSKSSHNDKIKRIMALQDHNKKLFITREDAILIIESFKKHTIQTGGGGGEQTIDMIDVILQGIGTIPFIGVISDFGALVYALIKKRWVTGAVIAASMFFFIFSSSIKYGYLAKKSLDIQSRYNELRPE